MKTLKIFIVFFSITSHSFCQSTSSIDSINLKVLTYFGQENLRKDFPYFSFRSIDGQTYQRKNLIGKITLINFWYASCVPCLSEFNSLNDLFSRFESNKRFQFLSFTFENETVIKQIITEYKLKYPIISISNDSLDILNFHQGYPTNIIVNKNGKIEYFFEGGVRTSDEAKKIINSVLVPAIENALKD